MACAKKAVWLMRHDTRVTSACGIAAILIVFGWNSDPSAQGRRQGGPAAPAVRTGTTTIPEVKHDASPALSSLPAVIAERGGTPHRVRRIPVPARPARGRGPRPIDPSIQTTAASAANSLDPITGFEGIGAGLKYRVKVVPSDINGSVGTTQFVGWANDAFAIFNKKTGLQYGPADGNVVWKGFGGRCETDNDGDPIVQYDKMANRWIMTQFAVSASPYYECIAVSTTADATGTYARYAFKYTDFNDYPKIGVWPDGYYATFNMFRGNRFLGSKVCAYDRAAMLKGAAASMQCFDVANQGGLLPADLDGTTPPPSGSPAFLMNFGLDSLNLWKLKIDWTDPKKSTLSGPSVIPVPTFDPACGNVGTCITQKDSTQKLDSLGDRLMYRLAYRNFGDHDSAVVNHSVQVGDHAGLRWYELRNIGTAPVVYQRGTYAPDSSHRWMGSAAMDKAGNILIGFSESGSGTFPSIRITGRSAGDPLHTLSTEFKAIDGTESQMADRWGDYTSMSMDPTDDCTFWFTAQYLDKATPGNGWHTYVAKTKFKTCR